MEKQLLPLNNEGNPIYSDLITFKQAIDQNPPRQWIATNKYSNNAKYIPIGIVEQLLSKLFPFWQVEQHGEPKILGNSVVISVHLKVFNPILCDWQTYAGVGAVPIEVKQGAHPIDFESINPKALHKNVPAALSFALSNAAKKIGKIFGSHLNRDEEI